jgi:hypothetical protein
LSQGYGRFEVAVQVRRASTEISLRESGNRPTIEKPIAKTGTLSTISANLRGPQEIDNLIDALDTPRGPDLEREVPGATQSCLAVPGCANLAAHPRGSTPRRA